MTVVGAAKDHKSKLIIHVEGRLLVHLVSSWLCTCSSVQVIQKNLPVTVVEPVPGVVAVADTVVVTAEKTPISLKQRKLLVTQSYCDNAKNWNNLKNSEKRAAPCTSFKDGLGYIS